MVHPSLPKQRTLYVTSRAQMWVEMRVVIYRHNCHWRPQPSSNQSLQPNNLFYSFGKTGFSERANRQVDKHMDWQIVLLVGVTWTFYLLAGLFTHTNTLQKQWWLNSLLFVLFVITKFILKPTTRQYFSADKPRERERHGWLEPEEIKASIVKKMDFRMSETNSWTVATFLGEVMIKGFISHDRRLQLWRRRCATWAATRRLWRHSCARLFS